jgi:hypothetical protein
MKNKRIVDRPTLEESRQGIALLAALLFLCFAYNIYMFFFWKLPPSMWLRPSEVPPYFRYPQDAMPFPETLEPSHFPVGPIREAYSVAKISPDLLVQQPC